MAVANIIRVETVNSAVAVQVNGTPFRVCGQPLDWQTLGPGQFHGLEVSEDKVTWVAATDVDGVAITTLGAVYRVVRERPEWARNILAAVGLLGTPFVFMWGVMKDNG